VRAELTVRLSSWALNKTSLISFSATIRCVGLMERSLLAIVMIPSLVGIHLGWSYMQSNRKLVTEAEQIDMPPVTVRKSQSYG